MNWLKIESALKECQKGTGAPPEILSRLGSSIPPDYREFLTRFDGVEGFVSVDQYLMLWRAEDICKLNSAYGVDEFAPGILLLGSDGGDTGFGYDLRTGVYLRVPLIGMSLQDCEIVARTFEDLIEVLAKRS